MGITRDQHPMGPRRPREVRAPGGLRNRITPTLRVALARPGVPTHLF